MDPWERQDGESAKAYEAFQLYRDASPSDRSLRKLAEQIGKSRTLIERWSSGHEWGERVAAWDAHNDAIRRAAMAAEAQMMGERHARLARRVLDMVAEKLESIDPTDLPPAQLSRLIDTASKLERLALGEPSERVETTAATPDEVKRFLAGQ